MGVVLQSATVVQKANPLCSVCIANFNGLLYLAKCIDSILAQKKFPGEIEIIVHDDASADGSVELLRTKYPEVQLLESKENVGFCISNNRMVAVAKGTFILLLNNDAALHDDALVTLYNASLKFGDGIYGLPQYDAETENLIDIGSTFDLFLNPIPNTDTTIPDVGMVIGACLWLPKSLWKEFGGFPEWFGSMAEDMYFCCLARLWGYSVIALPDSGFNHWVGRSFGGGKVSRANKLSTSKKRRSLSEKNKTFVMCICYPLLLLLLLLPVHLLLLCLEGGILAVIKRDRAIWINIYWNVLRELIRHRGILLASRARIQKKRKISLLAFTVPISWVPYKISMLIRHGVPEVK